MSILCNEKKSENKKKALHWKNKSIKLYMRSSLSHSPFSGKLLYFEKQIVIFRKLFFFNILLFSIMVVFLVLLIVLLFAVPGFQCHEAKTCFSSFAFIFKLDYFLFILAKHRLNANVSNNRGKHNNANNNLIKNKKKKKKQNAFLLTKRLFTWAL